VFAADRTPATMADAAAKFVAALSPEQRADATFPFDAEDRSKWHFIPTEMFPRKGLILGRMTEAQRTLAQALLQSGLSQRGYMTATAVMDLETVLNAIETGGKIERNPTRYFFSVFGTPSARGAWGWKVEGHHVSLNFTVVNGSLVSATPSFFGSNPAEVREGPKKGLRVLAEREDLARDLLMTLNPAQRQKAVLSPTAPDDIVTMNNTSVTPLDPIGVGADALDASQREQLLRLVDSYVAMMPSDVAAERSAALKQAGVEKIAFAWAGEAERGKKHYYRVQGPTFLIEFDNTQNNGNHVHSVWRDFNGDFGRDLLREHLKSGAHD
jgi:hypothetical protein